MPLSSLSQDLRIEVAGERLNAGLVLGIEKQESLVHNGIRVLSFQDNIFF